jgi:phosphohistidine phosphatase SixA
MTALVVSNLQKRPYQTKESLIKMGEFMKISAFLTSKTFIMSRIIIVMGLVLFVFSSCSHSYFIVRHAEKETAASNGSTDVPLTATGQQRALALKEILKGKKIGYVFSTNTIRTKSTAQPTADYFHITPEIYGPRPDSAFITLLKTKKKNTLIVCHSNTIDDVVNMLCGSTKVPGDLPETEFSKLFIVKMKGKKLVFSESSIPSVIRTTPKF